MSNSDLIRIRVTKFLKKEIKEIAKQEGRTMSNYILWVVKNDIKNRPVNK